MSTSARPAAGDVRCSAIGSLLRRSLAEGSRGPAFRPTTRYDWWLRTLHLRRSGPGTWPPL
jgi:hypothetical protein